MAKYKKKKKVDGRGGPTPQQLQQGMEDVMSFQNPLSPPTPQIELEPTLQRSMAQQSFPSPGTLSPPQPLMTPETDLTRFQGTTGTAPTAPAPITPPPTEVAEEKAVGTVQVKKGGNTITVSADKYQDIYAPAGWELVSGEPTAPREGGMTVTSEQLETFGTTAGGERIDATHPDVQRLMNQGVNLDAAIGSVVGQMDRRPRTTVTSQAAQEDVQTQIRETQADIERISGTPPSTTDLRLSQLENIGQTPTRNSDEYLMNVNAIDDIRRAMIEDLQSQRDRLPAQNQASIDQIMDAYEKKRQEEKTRNLNRQKSLEIIGTQSGRQRYAPGIQGDIIDTEVKEGIDRLNVIDAEERRLIEQAKSAMEAEDFKLLGQQRQLLLDARNERNETIDRMHRITMDRETMAIQRSREQRENNKDTLTQLDIMATVGGRLSDDDLAIIDESLGYGQGFSSAYMDYSRNKALAESAAATQKNMFDTAKNVVDIASKIKEGDWLDVGDTRIFGTKEIDFKRNLFEDTIIENGIQYKIRKRINPETGAFEIIDTVRLGDESVFGGNVPTSYKEWQLSGSPGQYKDWVKKSGLRPLPASDVRLLSEGNQLPLVLDSVAKILEDQSNLFGPIRGQMTRFPYAVEHRKVDDDLRRASQVIGRFMEGGVLRKEDEEKYRKMLPQITDTVSVAKDKLEGVRSLLENKVMQYLTDYEAGGFDVSEFIGKLPGTDVLNNGGNIDSFNTEDDFIRAYPGKVDMYFDLMDSYPNDSWEQLRERIKIIDPSLGFKGDLSTSLNYSKSDLSKLRNGETTLSIGEGTVTGIDGSKFWKHGLDFVLKGGKGAFVSAPFPLKVLNVISGFSNPSNKPLGSAGKKQNGGFGNQVKAKLPNGDEVWISHLDRVANLKPGEIIYPGQSFATQGNTGNTYGQTGVHLDITMLKPNGQKYTPREIAAIFGDQRLQSIG